MHMEFSCINFLAYVFLTVFLVIDYKTIIHFFKFQIKHYVGHQIWKAILFINSGDNF